MAGSQAPAADAASAKARVNNVAFHKIAFSSEVNDPENEHSDWLVDGRLSRQKASGVKAGPTAFIGVDLGGVSVVSRVVIHWHQEVPGVFGKAYTVETSQSLNGPYEVVFSTNDGDGGCDQVRFAPQQARYVRVVITEAGPNRWRSASMAELEVFGEGPAGRHTSLKTILSGRPRDTSSIELSWTPVPGAASYVIRRDHHRILGVKDADDTLRLRDDTGADRGHLYEVFVVDSHGQVGYPPADLVIGPAHTGAVVSRHQPVTASSVNHRWAPPFNIFHPGKVVSNNRDLENRGWAPARNAQEWLRVDLGEVCSVSGVTVVWSRFLGPAAKYQIEASLDGASWSLVREGAGTFAPAKARFVRLFIHEGGTRPRYEMIQVERLEVIGQRP